MRLISPLFLDIYARVRCVGKCKPGDFAAEDTNGGGRASAWSSLYLFKEVCIIGRIDTKPHREEARRKVGGSKKYQLKGVGIAGTRPRRKKGMLIELTR